ncbi:Hsp70 family protein [Rhizobium alvei]|uniref:Molecular chaperone HscC n=1 Tax=Rhizobium alvei TaxID=1132659 RepID=A0ABT8YIK5_9HYPH|nr:molecular chaperone HscC [Rhizobium alvei]MDO6963527.1 molecular chaperone HscC [Rhizobium alvei]
MALIGIDLGTTNSLIGVFQDGGPVLIPNAHGSLLTPSVVAVDKDGNVVVGAAAREMALTDPTAAVSSFKRWMGTEKTVEIGKKTFRAEELSALVLRSLMEDFRSQSSETIDEIVISCPAYFNDTQRKATFQAAHLAGLKVDRLINEPTAAILAYGLEVKDDGQFLVLDLGGGTFDVSIMHKFDGVFEIRASSGDNFLGGNDFSDRLGQIMARKAALSFEDLSRGDRVRILRAADKLKIELSMVDEAKFRFPLSGGEIEGHVSRSEFEAACEDLVRRLRHPMERALRDAAIDPSELDAIILVGGATRMPLVRQMVARLFGKFPFTNINPDEVVARGAVIQAALKARDAAVEDVLLTDICPFTLGVGSSRDRPDGQRERIVTPIIHRNAIVPISRSENFTTVSDDQTKVAFPIYQGENLRPEHNVMIGEIEVAVPKGPAGRETISVRFTYDINGALQVEAVVDSNQNRQTAVFANTSGLDEKELARRFEALAAIKLAPRDQQENRELISRAERLYAEALGDDRQVIADGLMRFHAELEDQKIRNLDAVRAEFRRFLDQFDTFVFRED